MKNQLVSLLEIIKLAEDEKILKNTFVIFAD